MKKIKRSSKIIILVLTLILSGIQTSNVAYAETTVKTNVNKISVVKGEVKKVIVKNTKNFKIKVSNKKIISVVKSGSTLKVKGKKAGSATLTISSKNMKSKKIKVTVNKIKNVKDKNTGLYTNSKIKGAGDKYRTDIESYPYLKNFDKLNKYTKEYVRLQWKAIPSPILNAVAYKKVQITFTTPDNKILNGMYGITTFEGTNSSIIKIYSSYTDDPYDCDSLIHECVHAYEDVMTYTFGINPTDLVKNDFKKNPKMYGNYGSKNISEFFAESISVPLLKKIDYKVQLDEDESYKNYIEEYIKGAEVKERVREVTTRKEGTKRYLYVYVWNMKVNYRVIQGSDGQNYINGMLENDFHAWRKEELKKYYENLYKDRESEYEKITIYIDATYTE